MVGLVACGGQEDDVAELSMWSDLTRLAESTASRCDGLLGEEEQTLCAEQHGYILKPCPYPDTGYCYNR